MRKKDIFDRELIKGTFSRLYGHNDQVLAGQLERYRLLTEWLSEVFPGDENIYLFSTPGRVEIGGNHTDHNLGKVLAAGVNLDAAAAACKNSQNRITLYSRGYTPAFSVDLADLEMKAVERGSTSALIRGIAGRFRALGYHIGGFDACLDSQVMPGSGLSSSATIEILIATILNTLFNRGEIGAKALALAGQYAENQYFGKPCGLMDQLTCALGGIVSIDFKDPQKPAVRKVAFDLKQPDFALLVVNTGGSHELLTQEYSAIRQEMESVAQALGHKVCRQVSETEILGNLARLRRQVGDRAVLRALHFLDENRRVDEQVEALEKRDFSRFLDLVSASGNSSCRWLQNCFTGSDSRNQGVSLALALSERYIRQIGKGACRVHGGGFAGTILALLPGPGVPGYTRLMEGVFGRDCVLTLDIRALGSLCLNPSF